jgi:phospholipid/cholesterol/gamma-HCH transport system permease protein
MAPVMHHPTPTSTFPIPQRLGLKFFRRISRVTFGTFGEIGLRGFFLRDTVHALGSPRTYLPMLPQHLRRIGVDSLPLTAIVAAFIGGVTAYQTRYQLFPGVQLSVVGWILRQTIVLELGPLLTALVLTGRVGARMTAEIGTMRVTEQIDALETLAFDPHAYLIVPRLMAAIIMLPLLTIMANSVGITAGGMLAVALTDLTVNDFVDGLRLAFIPFQVIYSLMKATLFGAAIAFFCSYEGFATGTGAEGVGNATARAVVITSVVILFLDVLIALYFAERLLA